MAFSISFLVLPPEYPYEDTSTKAARGRIVLGEMTEEFLSSLHDWTQEEYREQWRRSIQSLLNGRTKAVLITSFVDSSVHSHLEWWALYREGSHVFAQNQLLFFDDLENRFDPKRAADFLQERCTKNEEGLPISEWIISMDDLEVFADQAGFTRE